MKFRNIILAILALSLGALLSCSKNKDIENKPFGDTYVSIVLSDNEETEQIQSFSLTKRDSISNYQSGSVSSNNGCEIMYEFVPVNDEIVVPNLARASVKKSALSPGVQYRVLIYNDDNSLNFDKIYTYSTSSLTNINLDAGKEYTFIIYSFNNTNLAANSLNNKENLTRASLQNINEELLFYKNKVKLAYGANSLNVVLKYMFSSISTTITVDRENIYGPLTSLTNAFFKPTSESAMLSLQSGTLIYNAESSTGVPVIFPTIPLTGVYSITSSSPAKLLTHGTANGEFLIGDLVVDGQKKSNLTLKNIKINPGVKYKLNLTIKTCTETIETNIFNWNYIGINNGAIKDSTGTIYQRGESLISKVTARGSDFGYVMNITKLDNSFNMQINPTLTNPNLLAPSEIQFETKTSVAQNIRFKDGAKHQGANAPGLSPSRLPAIYSMSGTNKDPLIRVFIDIDGNVRMFAKKTQADIILYEMELFNPSTNQTIPFNKVTWFPSNKTNQVVVNQRVDNTTALIGVGVSKNIVSCYR